MNLEPQVDLQEPAVAPRHSSFWDLLELYCLEVDTSLFTVFWWVEHNSKLWSVKFGNLQVQIDGTMILICGRYT